MKLDFSPAVRVGIVSVFIFGLCRRFPVSDAQFVYDPGTAYAALLARQYGQLSQGYLPAYYLHPALQMARQEAEQSAAHEMQKQSAGFGQTARLVLLGENEFVFGLKPYIRTDGPELTTRSPTQPTTAVRI